MNELTEPNNQVTPKNQIEQTKKPVLVTLILLLFFALGAIVIFILFITSSKPLVNEPHTFEIVKGMSVRDIAAEAKETGLVRSELALYSILTSFYDPTNIHAGQYVFSEPMSVFAVAKKIASSDVEETMIALTIPEGMRADKIAQIADKNLTQFVVEDYLRDAVEKEGYLYPETYYVPEEFTAEQLIELQTKTYEDNVAPLRNQIASSTLTEYEVVTLASVIEREANSDESMKMVAGILLNRLEIGMALQADATIEYVLENPLNELKPGELAENLRELDSPYNSYLNTGLPPTPIGNPGIMAIKAVLEPTPSDYLFYITDNEGEFHYAETLSEHNANVANYLR